MTGLKHNLTSRGKTIILLWLIVLVCLTGKLYAATSTGTIVTNTVTAFYRNSLMSTNTNYTFATNIQNPVTNLSMIIIKPSHSTTLGEGETVTFSHIVSNYGNVTNTVQLLAISTQGFSNNIYYDTNNNGILDASDPPATNDIRLAPEQISAIIVQVFIPLMHLPTIFFDTIIVSGTNKEITNLSVLGTEDYLTILPATNVWNISQDKYYNTIMSAVSNASNNNVIEVVTPQVYNEQIILAPSTTSATHITIGTKDWWTNGSIGNVRLTSSGGINIQVSDGYSLNLSGFVITNNYMGAYLTNATGSTLQYNYWVDNTNAIMFKDSDNILIYSNIMRNNYLNLTIYKMKDSLIKFNKIYDSMLISGAMGIALASNYNQNVSIISNEIYNINNTGLILLDIVDSTIKGNKSYSNLYNGINLKGDTISATNNYILNNKFYNNQFSGLILYGMNYNNFVWNNKMYNNTNGARVDDSRNTSFSNNLIYSNYSSGFVFHGTSSNNIFVENRVYENDVIGVYLGDNNVNYNIIRKNYIYNNTGYGIGIMTNCDYNEIIDNYLITHSTNGIILYQDNDGTIIKNNIIASNKNGIVVYATNGKESDNLIINDNKIYSNSNVGISLERVRYAGITNNIIYNSKYGIITASASNCCFISNTIYSCITNGFALVGDDADDNIIMKNNISDIQSGCGIYILLSDYNLIKDNIVHNNKTQDGSGIVIHLSSISNVIRNNIVYSNELAGIALSGNNCEFNSVFSNTLYRNNIGVLATGKENKIYENWNITYNSNGIKLLYATNCEVYNNFIVNNYKKGLQITNSGYQVVRLNTIASNDIGVDIADTVFNNFTKNNICDNVSYNLFTSDLLSVTNTWWGSTIATQINNSISGLSYSNFIPYRLFGEFNIELGADTTNFSSVGSLTSQIVSITNVALSWNVSSGAVRYFIYRTNINSWSNFTKNRVIGVSTGTNWTNFNVPDGTNYWWVTALDDPSSIYTNETWYSASTFEVIDKTPPYFTNLSPANGQVNVATNANIVFNLFDNVSVVSQYIIVKIDGTTVLTNGGFIGAYSGSIDSSNSGWNVLVNPGAPFAENTTITVYAYGEDDSGNTNDIIWIFTTTDTTIPYFTNVSPTNNQINVATNENIVFNIFDNVSVVSQSIVVRVAGTTVLTNGGFMGAYSGSITASNNGYYVFVNPNNPFEEWTNVNVYLYGGDDNGNTTNMSFVFKTTDGTPPDVVTLISPINNSFTNGINIDFLWNISSDSGSGVTNYSLHITNINANWGTNITSVPTNQLVNNLQEGSNYWSVRASDRAGNIGKWSSTNILVVDLTGPLAVNLIRPPDEIWTNSVSIEFVWTSGNDALSGITNYNLFVTNNSGWFTNVKADVTNIIVANIHEGTNQWNVIAFDRAGNPGQISSTNIVKVDTNMPPAVTLVLPVNNYMTNNSNMDFTWNIGSDTLSGVTNYRLNITNYGGWCTNIITIGTNYTGINIKEGTNYWKVYAKDRAGNIGLWSITNGVILDTIDPTAVSLISPTNNTITNGNNIDFLWNISSDSGSGITNYRFQITNINTGWRTNFVMVTTNTQVSSLAEGTNWWRVRASDRAGNIGDWSTNMLLIDMTGPSNVTLLSPTNNTITNQTTMDFVWTRAEDTLSGVAYYEIQISTNNNFTSIWSNATVTATNYIVSSLEYGTNWWRVRATDKAGNIGLWSSTNLFNIKIDLGVVWITNRPVGNAWNSTMLRSDPETGKELVALQLQALTFDDAAITRIKISLDYTNGAIDSDFTNFILYQDTVPNGTINGGDVTIKTDAAAVGGWIVFDNISGLTILSNATMDFLVTFDHHGTMTDTQGIKAVITGNDAVTFSVYGVSTSNSTAGSGKGITKEVHEPGSFKILHAAPVSNWIGYTNQWNNITVEVRRASMTNEVVTWYDGVVTLDTTGIGLVEWDNISGLGTFSNITATTQGYYRFVSGDNGVIDLRLRDNTAETLNVELSSVTGITDDDTEGLLIIKYGELAYFEISHRTNYEIGTWGEVVIKAITTTHGSPVVLLDYNGVVTISVSGSGTNVDWTNSGSANGTLITNSIGGGTYNFTLADSGVVTLYIRDSMVEAVDVDVRDGSRIDTDTEGLIYFIPLEPYIVSMSVPKNSYATVSEVNALTILFSRIVTPGSVMSNINFYNIDNVPYSINFSFATNVSPYIPQSVVTINPGLNENEILKQFWIEIKTNIHTAINQYLVINPFNSAYSAPYYSLYTTLIDKNIGGTVNSKGKDVTLIIKNNVLPDDAYISINNVLPSGNSIIEEANTKARANQFIKVIESVDIYKEINAFNRNLNNISILINSAQLYINYSDSNNDGLVDNTSILESYLKLFVLNEDTKEWDVIEKSYVDTANNKVYGDIKHLSIFTIMGCYESDNFDDSFLTFPNPADIGMYTVKIKFYLEKDAKMDIKIYTITGELVRHLTKDKVLSGGMRHFIEWDGKNGVGLQVVNGVYLLKVEGEYTDGSGKISKTWKQGIIK